MKREKLQQLAHLIAGIITLVYGFDAFEAADFSSAAYYLTLAIIFLIIAGTHKWISEKFIMADVAFNLLEAATIVYSGWNYKNKGHEFLFYSMAVAGAFYLVFAIVNLFPAAEPKRKSSKRKRRKRSSKASIEEQRRDNRDTI